MSVSRAMITGGVIIGLAIGIPLGLTISGHLGGALASGSSFADWAQTFGAVLAAVVSLGIATAAVGREDRRRAKESEDLLLALTVSIRWPWGQWRKRLKGVAEEVQKYPDHRVNPQPHENQTDSIKRAAVRIRRQVEEEGCLICPIDTGEILQRLMSFGEIGKAVAATIYSAGAADWEARAWIKRIPKEEHTSDDSARILRNLKHFTGEAHRNAELATRQVDTLLRSHGIRVPVQHDEELLKSTEHDAG